LFVIWYFYLRLRDMTVDVHPTFDLL